MKTAIYPGSFNPFHDGHKDVLTKALSVFDHVIIAVGINPEKITLSPNTNKIFIKDFEDENIPSGLLKKVSVVTFDGLLVDEITRLKDQGTPVCAVIRGLRNGHDLQFEMNQQFWNEDLGLKVPVVYFITDRKLSHISSSAIRQIKSIKERTGKE